jgi:flagellar biosynthetic protein FlhB
VTRSPADAVVEVASVAVRLVQVVAVVCVLIGVGDYAMKRRDHQKELKMSKHDIRQEHKESEGDPHVRAQQRSQRLAMSRNRMLGAVSSADVVITNPTHFAVALSYDQAKGAPRVVARGADALAAKIREEARKAGVPCVESKLLARTLYRVSRPGEEIPAELYQAVATVLAFLHRVEETKRSVGAVYGLDVVDTWTPTDGALERISPAQRRRAARRRQVGIDAVA